MPAKLKSCSYQMAYDKIGFVIRRFSYSHRTYIIDDIKYDLTVISQCALVFSPVKQVK